MNGLVIYPQELRAARGAESIDLSPRENAILALLHEHAGEVIDRDTFFNRCWGFDYAPDSRTLDQHVAKLRKKIEADPAQPVIIETVRGAGYRYRAR
jgi:DNA-binding response OmpR family regulator